MFVYNELFFSGLVIFQSLSIFIIMDDKELLAIGHINKLANISIVLVN
ncbi:hypothetical protein ACQKML_20545 [Peribacillus frigoritolerans]